jgi:protein-disulfide isomerase
MLEAVPRNRILLLGAVLGAAVVIAVVLVVVLGSGSDSTATTTTTLQPEAVGQGSLTGVPQKGDTLGLARAPVTLTVFEDPQCPFCRDWSLNTLPTVIKRYIRPGRVKLVYRGIPIIGPNSVQGLKAIYAAGEQNKLWTMSEELYRRQGAENTGWITDPVIRQAARASAVNVADLQKAASSAAVAAAVTHARIDADFAFVQGTPTFIIERPPRPPKQLAVTGLDPASFTTALNAALR